MRQIRLYVDMPLAGVSELTLPAAVARHAVRVLRLAVGQAVTLFNGDGCDYAGGIEGVEGNTVKVRLHERRELANESPWPLTLVQCLAKGDKMDLVVQKATELGVSCIVPVLSERSEVRLDAARADKRLKHWQAIVASACEQCGRARLPVIETPQPLAQWLKHSGSSAALRLALMPGEEKRVRDLIMPDDGAILVVGPEGGLGERDIAALTSADFSGLALGPRILRTETAGLAALAAIQACHGDI
ncbi:MAG TPA: 16S rRNA (uracil(1498)-N(3))-methyltransferase [Rhodanobacteraceae bacterium]|nr:16S rRNA (uracil(1498)-N(3))-methyltransferase [Rhodanobacteraceae bacterium]